MPFYTFLKTTLPRILPWVIAAVFLLLIAWQVVPMFISSTEMSVSTTSQTVDDPRLQKIVASEIFGVLTEDEDTPEESAEPTENDDSPQITSLPYVLKGVITAATPEKGSAIIEISPGDSRYFSAGREITRNVKLAAVHNNHVVINNQGQNETLELAELSLSMATPSTPSANFADQPDSDSTSDDDDSAPPSRDERNATPGNNQDPEDMIKRDRIRQRLEELRARNPS